jgi:hypothetical protein
MEDIRNRATDRFPTVLLTLLSIVQALALELLWDHLHDRPDLYEVSWIAVAGWMQIAASLNGIILIWLTYSGMVMRVRWTPSTGDSIMPFFIGLIEFLMIDMLGPDKFGQWLIVLAIIFATMIVVSHHIMRRSRSDSTNAEFFAQFSPARKRDFVPQFLVISAMILSGGWLWISGYHIGMIFFALLSTLAVLGYETNNAAKYWTRSMGG